MKLFITCLTIFAMTLNAQLEKGINLTDFGIDLSSFVIPIHLRCEQVITNEIGLALNYTSYKDKGNLNNNKWTFTYGGVKGNYHFNELFQLYPKFDD